MNPCARDIVPARVKVRPAGLSQRERAENEEEWLRGDTVDVWRFELDLGK